MTKKTARKVTAAAKARTARAPGRRPGAEETRSEVQLPPPRTRGGMSLAEAIQRRRSIRSYTRKRLTLAEVSQLLWSAQGITDDAQAYRATPSAGAVFPLATYVADAEGLQEYVPARHALRRLGSTDLRARLQEVCYDQTCVGTAPFLLLLAMDIAPMMEKYGGQAEFYCVLEAGHAIQNVHLQATALGLGGVPVAAFRETALSEVLGLPPGQKPVYLIPIGHPGAMD